MEEWEPDVSLSKRHRYYQETVTSGGMERWGARTEFKNRFQAKGSN